MIRTMMQVPLMLEEAVKSRADFYSLPGDASPGLALQLSTQTS